MEKTQLRGENPPTKCLGANSKDAVHKECGSSSPNLSQGLKELEVLGSNPDKGVNINLTTNICH